MKTLELNETEGAITNSNQFGLRHSPFDIPRDSGRLEPGQLYLANESRFNSAFFSEPLTTYATGWRDPHKIEELLDRACEMLDMEKVGSHA